MVATSNVPAEAAITPFPMKDNGAAEADILRASSPRGSRAFCFPIDILDRREGGVEDWKAERLDFSL